MEFTATASDLAAAVGLVRSVVPTRTTIPLLNNFLVEAKPDGILLTGTDMAVSLSAFEPCEIVATGQATLPAHALFALVKGLPSTKLVTIKVEEGRALLRCGKSSYNLGTIPVDGFPSMPEVDDADIEFSISAEDLMEMIAATRSTTLDNVEDRYFLQGICVHTSGDDIVFASLNGKQFAQIRKSKPSGLRDIAISGSPIIPNGFIKAAATALAAQEDAALVAVKIGKRRASFSVGDITLAGRLIEGQFPLYESMLPDLARTTFRVTAGDLGEALARLGIVYIGTDQKAPAVIIGCGKGVIDLSAGKSMGDQGAEIVEAEIVEKSAPFCASIQYLSQMVSQWPSDATLSVFSGSPSDPILIKSDDVPNLMHVVMPMTPSTQTKRQVAAEAA